MSTQQVESLTGTIEPTGYLITIPSSTVMTVFTEPGALDLFLERIAEEARKFNGDVTTAKGRKEIASMAYRIAQTKAYLDGLGKDLVAKMKEMPRTVDMHRKGMREYLDSLRDEVRVDLTKWEEEQEKRSQYLTFITVLPTGMRMASSTVLAERIEEINDETVYLDDPEVMAAKCETLTTLQTMLGKAKQAEQDAADLLRLRQESAAREQKEREEQIRIAAAAKAKAEAEEQVRIKLETAKRKEAEAKLAQERAKQATAIAEERRKSAEADAIKAKQEYEAKAARAEEEAARVKAEAEARERNVKHRKRVNAEVLDDLLQWGLSADDAGKVVAAICAGEIRHVSISY